MRAVRLGRALVVDDSVAVRREVVAALDASKEFEPVRECADGLSALKAMAESKPDVVVCDLVMPGCDGIQFLRLLGGNPDFARIPVLMLTSADDQEGKVELLERGAADHITKPFHARELLARVRIHCRHRILQEELEEANRRLYELSCTDALTGIFNRRHLDRVLEAEVSRHARYRTPLTLLLVDVDHFKRVNDDFGHDVGDTVLRNIAETLRRMVRKADIVARYGGEEMCVILSNTSAMGAGILAERLRAALEKLQHPTSGGAPIRATASFGSATLEADSEPVDVATLMRRADQALYAAKEGGRNRVEAWLPRPI
jgi:diguanylate cyclase (GGDEF)-like protein